MLKHLSNDKSIKRRRTRRNSSNNKNNKNVSRKRTTPMRKTKKKVGRTTMKISLNGLTNDGNAKKTDHYPLLSPRRQPK